MATGQHCQGAKPKRLRLRGGRNAGGQTICCAAGGAPDSSRDHQNILKLGRQAATIDAQSKARAH
eukprot:6753611-Alexandrium_andersonii.AAC.1